MKILLTGSNGQLGWELIRQGNELGLEMKGVDLPEFDLTDPDQVKNTISNFKPSLIINAAAYTNVDGAETEQNLAFLVNRDAPAHLAQLCLDTGIPLIHFSTDYVFDGQKEVPYKEADPVSPINAYGQSKLEGEINIHSILDKYIIIRTSWLYGIHGHNFVKTMLRLGMEKESIQVVNDQFGSPTNATDLAESVIKIALKIKNKADICWGTYHYCGKGITTWHGFAQAIFNVAKKRTNLKIKRVDPVPSTFFRTKADRPAYSTLDCKRISKYFSIDTKPWRKSLEIMINRLFDDHQ